MLHLVPSNAKLLIFFLDSVFMPFVSFMCEFVSFHVWPAIEALLQSFSPGLLVCWDESSLWVYAERWFSFAIISSLSTHHSNTFASENRSIVTWTLMQWQIILFTYFSSMKFLWLRRGKKDTSNKHIHLTSFVTETTWVGCWKHISSLKLL